MTQEEKIMLLKDLCGRIPYGVKIDITWWCMGEGFSIDTTLEPDHIDEFLNDSEGETEIKPYLRPMSSMTEEEKEELVSKHIKLVFEDKNHNPETVAVDIDGFDWLNAHHFDYRGLIPLGLAIEAPEGMYNN